MVMGAVRLQGAGRAFKTPVYVIKNHCICCQRSKPLLSRHSTQHLQRQRERLIVSAYPAEQIVAVGIHIAVDHYVVW